MQGSIYAPYYTDFPLWPTKQNIIKDPADYLSWCEANNLIPALVKKSNIIRIPDKLITCTKKRDGSYSIAQIRKVFYNLLIKANRLGDIPKECEAWLDAYEWDISCTRRKYYNMPLIKHSDRIDYAYSREDEIHARLRFLKEERKYAELDVAYYVRDLFNHYNSWSESELYKAQIELDKIDKNIKYNRARLKFKEDDTKEQYDIARCKQVPLDRITNINAAGFFINNPFREEHSPSNSLHWDKKSNRYTDFGTSKHGDSVDLFKAINNCSTGEALKELSKM
jgi:hypothetical protein